MQDDGTMLKKIYGKGCQLIFSFVRGDGTSTQWNEIIKNVHLLNNVYGTPHIAIQQCIHSLCTYYMSYLHNVSNCYCCVCMYGSCDQSFSSGRIWISISSDYGKRDNHTMHATADISPITSQLHSYIWRF